MVEYFTVGGRRTTEMPPETKIGPKGQTLQRIGSYIPGRGGTFTYREIAAPPAVPVATTGMAPSVFPTLGNFAGGIVSKAQTAFGNVTATQAALGGVAVAGAIGAGIGLAKLSQRRPSAKRRKASSRKKAKKGRPKKRAKKAPAGKRSTANAKRNKRGGAVKARYKGKKVLLTKNGQPYVIMGDGKARFIKR